MSGKYKILKSQVLSNGKYSIIPIRMEDRYLIMQWRNEQIDHLRQNKPLTEEEQDKYFIEIVAKIFNQERPNQILFSYLEGDKCIGYGGFVHINWKDRNAEISFIMETNLEKKYFDFHWSNFLRLIEYVAIEELKFHKIFTYAFDIRPEVYKILEKNAFEKEAILKDHCLFQGKFINVIIHSKILCIH